MTEVLPTVLFIDDEPNVLSGLRRSLYGRYEVLTAENGPDGLELLADHPETTVVVSDMRMPGIDGVETLVRAREQAPGVVRMLLTGHADLDAAVRAVNRGRVFRFLAKPIGKAALIDALEHAVEQHRLLRAERELTEGTLRGVVSVLSDVLAVAHPSAHATTGRVVREVRWLCEELELGETWDVELAARLASIGGIAVPDEVLVRAALGGELTADEQDAIDQVPDIGADLLAQIPRLEDVAEMVRRQERQALDADPESRAALGAGVLRAAVRLERARTTVEREETALQLVLRRVDHHPRVREVLERRVGGPERTREPRRVALGDLTIGMTLTEDLLDLDGKLLLSRGHEVSEAVLARIHRFQQLRELPDDIEVV